MNIMSITKPCNFCTLPPGRIVNSNANEMTIRDGFPVSPGHTLIIPKRHVGSFFELTPEERSDLLNLLDAAKSQLDEEDSPQGYNIGINDGPDAGQTVPHLHIHLIPRYDGDLPDPRGGVRWVIPHKAVYWTK
jgi:diadenosine tetraphosphate (Ap4A) HIT family hydrolase